MIWAHPEINKATLTLRQRTNDSHKLQINGSRSSGETGHSSIVPVIVEQLDQISAAVTQLFVGLCGVVLEGNAVGLVLKGREL